MTMAASSSQNFLHRLSVLTFVYFNTLLLLSLSSISLSLPLLSSSSLGNSSTTKNNISQGFSLSLIDSTRSPHSPFYNPNLTHSERIHASVRRSNSRLNHYLNFINNNGIDSINLPFTIDNYMGAYIVHFEIGTPAYRSYAFMDTGSELPWIQCYPCTKCYNQGGDIFYPMGSSSYRKITCRTEMCQFAPRRGKSDCRDQKLPCTYELLYGDMSYTKGILSSETLTIDDTIKKSTYTIKDVIFGCGQDNKLTSQIDRMVRFPAGIVGLNRGRFSFLTQIKEHKFSYCLLSEASTKEGTTSRIHFGEEASIVGEVTPMLNNPVLPNHYFVNLEDISVNKDRLGLPSRTFNSSWESGGGFIVDSGTAFTSLSGKAIDALIESVKRKATIPDQTHYHTKDFELCYRCTKEDIFYRTPNLILHFTGMDLELTKYNSWIRTDHGDEKTLPMFCLAFLRSNSGVSLLGEHQQINVNVGFDTLQNIISFKPMDCITKI